MRKFIYVIGITCSGKDYVLDKLPFPSVRVGNILRTRYHPSYFQGSGAPGHTEKEALEIFNEEVEKLLKNPDVPDIWVSGQPRRVSQIKETIIKYPGNVCWLHETDEVLQERIAKRIKASPANEDLILKRLVNDRVQVYDVLFELSRLKIWIDTVTSEELLKINEKRYAKST